jgi:DNA modification methylase
VGEKPGAACRWYDESNQIENIIRPGGHGINKIIPSADHHPTPKPDSMAAHFMRLHSKRGDTVLDCFMGHGGTGVVAATHGRRFIGIEIDPQFFEVACRKIEAAYDQPLFAEPQAKPKQGVLL